jgi:thioesterase domain-containing protein
VRKLAEYLRSATPLEGCVSLVAITPRAARPPIFAVGGVGGNVIGFAELARALGPDQGFYALQSVGLDGTREPLDSIEAMASLYLSEMRSVQPRGPYALIGSCFGATVAYEMARRLGETGEAVALLGLLDPTSIGGEDVGRPIERPHRTLGRATVAGRFMMSRLQLYRRELHGLGIRERVVYVGGKLRTLLRRVSGRGSLEGVRLEINLMKVYRANLAALRRFERKPISGNVKLLAIFETPRRAQSRRPFDWGSGPETKVVRQLVTGDNSGDMLNGENARVLATGLAEQLKQAFEPE